MRLAWLVFFLILAIVLMYVFKFLGAIIFIVLVGVAIYYLSRPRRENSEGLREHFTSQVMGNLAPYRVGYFEALAECEREDPAKFAQRTKGNPWCSAYVDTAYTNLMKAGGPPPLPGDSITEALKYCGENRECVGDYFSQLEIAKKCVQDCAYSKLDPEECKEKCHTAYITNASSGTWTWK